MVVLCNLHTGGSAASIIMTPVATYAAAVSPVLTTLVASIRVGAVPGVCQSLILVKKLDQAADCEKLHFLTCDCHTFKSSGKVNRECSFNNLAR